MRRSLCAALVLLSFAACVRSVPYEGEEPTVEGPADVQLEAVRQHALQFDVDVPDRRPGSQHELAAASYLLGHLQLAGYSPRLDRVPVADTVSSTNVVAFPPGGAEPEFLVTVAYDTDASGRQQTGPEIGLFLELARALTVADPDHRVGFVALGAESADRRGTRRLAQFLLDEGVEPSVILIRPSLVNERGIVVSGACAGPASGSLYASTFTAGDCRHIDERDIAVAAAGFELTQVSGDISSMAEALTDFLIPARS